MADTPTVAGPAPPSIILKVLSPSPEVPPNGWTINDVPTGTTVAELKRRIQNVLPSHPPADRQRILYQGHFLPDAQTLNDAFGQQALSQGREFSVHLVLRQTANATPADTASATPARGGTPQQQPRLQMPGMPLPQPLPAQGHPPHLPNPLQRQALPPNPLNPLAAGMLPQMVQGIPGFAMPPMPGLPPGHNHFHGQQMVFPPGLPFQMPQPPQPQQGNGNAGTPQQQPQIPHPANAPPFVAWQHIVARQQMQRAAGGQQGVGIQNIGAGQGNGQGNANATTGTTESHSGDTPGQQNNGQQRPQTPGAQPMFNQAPTGVRYTVTYNQTIPMPPAGFQQPFHFALPGQQNVAHPQLGIRNSANLGNLPNDAQIRATFEGLQDLLRQAQNMGTMDDATPDQRRLLEDLTRRAENLRDTFTASADRFIEARRELESTIATTRGARPEASNASNQTPTQSVQPADRRGIAAGAAQPVANATEQPVNNQPTVYLLSSPTGPHGLVFASEGVFRGQFPQTNSSNIPILPSHANSPTPYDPENRQPTPTIPVAADQPRQEPGHYNLPPGLHVPDNAGAANRLVLRQPQHDAQAQQPPAAAANNPVQGLMAQFWLLLRVSIFVYVFMGSGFGWRRPLVVGLVGLAFWLVRSGFVGQGVQEAVQGWWEDVIGVREDGAQGGNGAAEEAQGQQREMPQWRQTIRPAERALALFVASLYPGIGERHVQARRDEENRRRREAEEQVRRIAQQAVEAAAAAAAVTEGSQNQPTEASTTDEGVGSADAPRGESGIASGAAVREEGDLRERRPAGSDTTTA